MKPNPHNFDVFWNAFHFATKQPKLSNRTQAEIEWNRCVIGNKKVQLIKSINNDFKCKLTALEYLRLKLKL